MFGIPIMKDLMTILCTCKENIIKLPSQEFLKMQQCWESVNWDKSVDTHPLILVFIWSWPGELYLEIRPIIVFFYYYYYIIWQSGWHIFNFIFLQGVSKVEVSVFFQKAAPKSDFQAVRWTNRLQPGRQTSQSAATLRSPHCSPAWRSSTSWRTCGTGRSWRTL